MSSGRLEMFSGRLEMSSGYLEMLKMPANTGPYPKTIDF